MAREKMADVLAQRDALRRRESLLEEALRATRRREAAEIVSCAYNDTSVGRVSLQATLVNPNRAHGGIVILDTRYVDSRGERHDVDVRYLEDWHAYYRADGITHGPAWYAEQTLAYRLMDEARRIQATA
jgi:hypothetical protein